MFESLIRKFLYHPIILNRDAPLPAYAADALEAWIPLSNGLTIHGLYWPADIDRPTLLYFHGNAQSVYDWALVREELTPLEVGLLLIDYPGYGKSEGHPTEDLLYISGLASLEWLRIEQNIPPNQIVILGKSLGGGVATEVVRHTPVKGLILESTFQSIPSVMRNLIPMVPSNTILKSERYASIEKIPHIHTPILVVHGGRDELIPLEEARSLYKAANNPKSIYIVEEAGHNDVSLFAGSDYGQHLRQWLNELGDG